MIDGQADWSKSQWRSAAKAMRGQLQDLFVDTVPMAESFLKEVKPKEGAVVGAYWPIGDELDIKPMLKIFEERGIQLALPRALKDGNGLAFYRWHWGGVLHTGPFNLKEPPVDPGQECVPDICLVPLLAFDRTGTRLGYGLGHFDRALSAKPSIVKIGVGHGAQEATPFLPSEAHDVKLDAVLTPKAFIRF